MSSAAPCHEILKQEGFQLIGQLNYRLNVSAWWHPSPDKLLQVLVVELGDCAIVKGDKSYYLKSVSAEGETWARDIGLLHDYLENHFPELRISFSHFRDVPPALARAEACRRMAIEAPAHPLPSVEQIAQLQRQLQAMQNDKQASEAFLSLSSQPSDLLSGYIHQSARSQQAAMDSVAKEIQRQKERLGLLEHLQREYQRKGSAAIYSFAISSGIHAADEPSGFQDALRAVVKELVDQDRYQVRQKLQGGRLNILVEEAGEPAITWIEQWMGGALSPMQLHGLGNTADALRKATSDRVMVTPDEDIVVDNHVRHAEKHMAAHVLSTVLGRLDKSDTRGHKGALDPESLTPQTMPLRVGLRTNDAGESIGPAVLPLTQMIHAYISGTTGSGKSFLARALVEEAAQYKGLGILILDPRNQFVGLLVPEDRPQILCQYEQFGMDVGKARGLAFDYYAPKLTFAPPLPEKLSSLAAGRSIVSFKSMDDEQRCLLAAKVLDAAFDTISSRESDRPRLLIVVDEAQLLTRKRVDESAKDAAAGAERALDRIAREGRKYGIVLVLVSQTIRDFSYELASLRQMTTTKIFLRNSDREIEYANALIGDGRILAQLPTGAALVHNANWGLHRIHVRPPYTKVFELSEGEIRQLFAAGNNHIQTLSSEARKLLSAIQSHKSQSNTPLNMSQAGSLAGITSKRRLQELVAELENISVIYTRRSPERGSPRVIELTNSSAKISSNCPDQTG